MPDDRLVANTDFSIFGMSRKEAFMVVTLDTICLVIIAVCSVILTLHFV